MHSMADEMEGLLTKGDGLKQIGSQIERSLPAAAGPERDAAAAKLEALKAKYPERAAALGLDRTPPST